MGMLTIDLFLPGLASVARVALEGSVVGGLTCSFFVVFVHCTNLMAFLLQILCDLVGYSGVRSETHLRAYHRRWKSNKLLSASTSLLIALQPFDTSSITYFHHVLDFKLLLHRLRALSSTYSADLVYYS